MENYIDMSKDNQNELLLKLIKVTAHREACGRDYFELMFSGTFRAAKAEDAEQFLGIKFKDVYPEIFTTEEFQTKLKPAADEFALEKAELQNIYYELSEIESRGLPEKEGLRFLFAKNAIIAKAIDKMVEESNNIALIQELKTELYKYALVAAYVTDKKFDDFYETKFLNNFKMMVEELNGIINKKA